MSGVTLNKTECEILSDTFRTVWDALNKPQDKKLNQIAQESMTTTLNMLRFNEIVEMSKIANT